MNAPSNPQRDLNDPNVEHCDILFLDHVKVHQLHGPRVPGAQGLERQHLLSLRGEQPGRELDLQADRVGRQLTEQELLRSGH